MTIDWIVCLSYISAFILAEYLIVKHPPTVHKWTMVFFSIAGGVFAGVITPNEWTSTGVMFSVAPHFFSIIRFHTNASINKWRVRRAVKGIL